MSYGFYEHNNSKVKIKIGKFILQETGTYNPMYSRPYETNITGHVLEHITDKIESSSTKTIQPELFTGMAHTVISPSATPQGIINIPFGWSERRIRFVLEVHVENAMGSTFIYYFQGYTNYLGISEGRNIDPNMEFVINSFLTVTRMPSYTQTGYTTIDKVTESSQVINGRIMTEGISDTHPGSPMGVYSMRPQDVFLGVSSDYLRTSREGYGRYGGSKEPSFLDARNSPKTDAISNSRQNGLISNYLSGMVRDYTDATALLEFGQDTANVYDRANGMSAQHESLLPHNLFMRAIDQSRGQVGVNTGVFTINDLINIDSNVSNVTNYFALGQTAKTQLPQAGDSAYWNSTDRETLVATLLSNGIPALMMELMISKIHFRTTNYDVTNRVTTTLIDAQSLTTADMTTAYQRFIIRLERELLFDISFGNQESFAIDVNINLFGESMISVGLNGQSMVSYSTPSFCDSLLTPVATTNRAVFEGVCSDFDRLFNNIRQSAPNAFAMNNSI